MRRSRSFSLYLKPMAVKPFQWKNLKKVSLEEVRLFDALFDLLPKTDARSILGMKIRKMLLRHLGEKSFYYLDSVLTETYGSFLGSLPDSPVIAVIGMEPNQGKVLAYIDNNLAFLLIDRLLGGGGEPSVEKRPLTETEEGVLQYFIMQVLAEIWQTSGRQARLHFRFERFCHSPQEVEKLNQAKDAVVSPLFKVGIGGLAGFIKIIFAASFLDKLKMTEACPSESAEFNYFIGHIGRYDYVKTSIWAEGGRAAVSSHDLMTLEAGDVILFDDSGIELGDGRPKGVVDLRVGRGEEGFLKAEIEAAGKTIRCRIAGS